ncbi:MAG TPA: FAD-binding oxidoreductase [Rubrobacteraceae bacterium]|nr:FAD-binding oxidoreductase [Rubrobacteraceae bacterium]
MEAFREEALGVLEHVFGDRLKFGPGREADLASGGSLAQVSPVNVGEVETLARLAGAHGFPVTVAGAGLSGEVGAEEGSVVVRFDLMRSTRLPEGEELWAEAEPGALWLTLDNELRLRGKGLAVYPTSAPRATVGGWLATGGLGVGSFEYGWLHDNVLSASVVLPGGERREVPGEELRSAVGEERTGIVVSARLRARRADADVPFAATFEDPEGLIGALDAIVGEGLPFWHLAFLSPGMTRARGLGEDYMIFGAYPEPRAARIEAGARSIFDSHNGRTLPAAETHRAWGERFFPVAPSHPTPEASRELIAAPDLARTIRDERLRAGEVAAQGTVVSSGDALLLSFDTQRGGLAR